jgi:hypothetical protein
LAGGCWRRAAAGRGGCRSCRARSEPTGGGRGPSTRLRPPGFGGGPQTRPGGGSGGG